jgi:hypothetical protein
VTAGQLARALYLTDGGTNGYPPLHLTIPWEQLTYRGTYFARAEAILRLLAPLTPKETNEHGS